MSHASRRAVPRTNQWGALAALLLDFQATPGRYATVAREPRLLFDHATEVLSLASGRSVEGLPADAELEERLRQAACFFVRVAMLRPGVDHYTLLGVAPGFDASVLREHYRMLIRLTHPDFAAGGGAWPADAATRVNQANDVLASPERRQRYDHAPAATSPRGPAPPARNRPAYRARLPHQRVQRRRAWPAVAGGLGVAVLLLAWFWQPQTQHERLVTLASAPLPEPAASNVAEKAEPEPGHPASLAVEPKPMPVASPAEPVPAPAATVAVAAEAPVVLPRDAGGSTTQSPAPARPVAPPPERHVPSATVVAPAKATRQPVAGGIPPALPVAAQGLSAAPSALRVTPPAVATSAAVAPSAVPLAVAALSPAQVTPALAPPVPAPVTVAAALPARPPVPAPAPAPAPPSRPVVSAAETLRMADVQPLLGQILGALESGRGEQVTRLVDRSARQGDGGARFVDTYNRALSGARVLRLGPVRFDGRASGEQLFVEGVVQLQIQDESHQLATRELVLRALFASRSGQPVLTQLSASDLGR